jgi:hypothetical protein
MSGDKRTRIISSELIFGSVFLALGVLDLVQGRTQFGLGFTLLGIAIILGSPLAHGLLDMDSDGPFTRLRLVSYSLALVALVIFAEEILGRLL